MLCMVIRQRTEIVRDQGALVLLSRCRLDGLDHNIGS